MVSERAEGHIQDSLHREQEVVDWCSHRILLDYTLGQGCGLELGTLDLVCEIELGTLDWVCEIDDAKNSDGTSIIEVGE